MEFSEYFGDEAHAGYLLKVTTFTSHTSRSQFSYCGIHLSKINFVVVIGYNVGFEEYNSQLRDHNQQDKENRHDRLAHWQVARSTPGRVKPK